MKRWTTSILLALGGLAPTLCSAQGPWDAPGAHESAFHSSSGPVQQAGWHHREPAYGPGPYGPGPYGAPPDPRVMAQLVPGGPLCDTGEPGLDLTFKEALTGSYFRLDYLLWNIEDGQGVLLGAPSTSTADLSGRTPGNRLPAVDPITGPRPLTTAIVPSIGESNDLNGLRATLGIPVVNGLIEAEIFNLEQAQWGTTILPFVDQPFAGIAQTVIGATTLLNNGVPVANRMILYSENYNATTKTNFWGTEGNWVLNPFTPNVPLEVAPLIGFRYLQLKDQLRIGGTDIPDPINSPDVILDHEILSLARNQIFGPQVGLRATANMQRLELGSELKLIAGINRISASVYSSEMFSPTEERTSSRDTSTEFAPILDLSLYGKFHFTDYFAVYAGYELLVGGGFSRSYNNVLYDSPGSVNNPSTIRLKSDLEAFYAHGLTVGGELRWR